jgi:hypothetical protein
MAIGAILLGGCSPAEPATSAVRSQPAFDFADNPSDPSPIIVNNDNLAIRIISADASQGLIAIHGPVAGLTVCTNANTRDIVDLHGVITPSTSNGNEIVIRSKDTHVTIYAGTDISPLFPFVPATYCAFIQNTTPLYQGVVQYTANLKDSGSDFRWEGDITRVADGVSFHYVEQQHTVTQGNSKSSINLHQNGK